MVSKQGDHALSEVQGKEGHSEFLVQVNEMKKLADQYRTQLDDEKLRKVSEINKRMKIENDMVKVQLNYRLAAEENKRLKELLLEYDEKTLEQENNLVLIKTQADRINELELLVSNSESKMRELKESSDFALKQAAHEIQNLKLNHNSLEVKINNLEASLSQSVEHEKRVEELYSGELSEEKRNLEKLENDEVSKVKSLQDRVNQLSDNNRRMEAQLKLSKMKEEHDTELFKIEISRSASESKRVSDELQETRDKLKNFEQEYDQIMTLYDDLQISFKELEERLETAEESYEDKIQLLLDEKEK